MNAIYGDCTTKFLVGSYKNKKKPLNFKSWRQIATPFRPPPPSDIDNMENETRRFNQTAVAYK